MSDLKSHIINLREDFTKGSLSESEVDKNPALQFELWLKQAIEMGVPEAQAMTLSTISSEKKPTSRIVYLREFENNCFCFYGNYNSRKAENMKINKNASINFFWPKLERQVRIEGTINFCSPQQSDNYFNSRPRESQIGAWASAQSAIIANREELEKKLEYFKMLYENKPVPRPDNWGGWVLKADYYEFWQGRKSRLHDRICYRLENNNWSIARLAP